MDKLIKQELQNGFFSAIQISSFSSQNQECFFSGFTTNESLVAIDSSTQFDLASLTKALFTTPAFYRLFAQKEIQPNTKLSSFFSSFSDDITLLSLLNHSAGFPAWIPFYEKSQLTCYADKKRAVIDAIAQMTPDYHTRYSDLTFLLLGFILEEIYSQPLLSLFGELKQDVVPLSAMRYLPSEGIRRATVASSFSPVRQALSQGSVEDENCCWLGGVTGHAGLFGSSDDVGQWVFSLMEKEWFREWFARTGKAGFDTPEPVNSSYGDNNPSDAAGHLGFTGTAFLFSLSERMVDVVLTNRTHTDPNKEEWKQRIKKIRRQSFHLSH
ncbi:serine hydrolase, partial [bacterium]|nr:serine hydrolase [bacterium]